MELWIRSQDGECLMKIDRADYDLSHNEHRIMVNGYKTLVGHYETKERALQVLDEIQNILQPRVITHEPVIDYDDMFHSLSENVAIHCTQQIETELKQAGQVVYQMPEE